jgi:protein CpxP
MSYSTKNKLLIGLLILLLLANIATIALFWLGKPTRPLIPKGQPAAYLVKQLGFEDRQKEAFMELVHEHQKQAETLRQQVKVARDNLFKLLQEPAVPDSEKIKAAKNISLFTEQLDLVTFEHFKKVRAICNAAQQKKFDNIIRDVMHMIAGPAPGDRRGFPPPGRGDEGPPPH